MTKNLLFLASGRGSNFQSFVDHVRLKVLKDVSISALICNQSGAMVLEKARSVNIPAFEIEGVVGRKFSSSQERLEARTKFDKKCVEIIRSRSIDFVVLAGFNQIVGKTLVEECPSKMTNIHPAYDLQSFGGKNMVGLQVHRKVIESGQTFSGCSVHLVTGEIDRGPLILKEKVEVVPNDTPEGLEKRVLITEHLVYPKAVQLLVDGRVLIDSGRSRCYVDQYSENWDGDWDRRQAQYFSRLDGSKA